MNRDEKYLARIMFKSKVYSSEGEAYQDLFVKVMQKYNSDFRPIKPQGSFGDRKNDGFIKAKGIYYQVYAPENIINRKRQAVKKLNEDFEGLLNYWSEIAPVKEYYFVINDKYKGSFPEIEEEISKLSSKYPEITFDLFLAKDLEDVFINLSDDDIIDIVGFIPNPEIIQNVDYSILNEVIGYLLEAPIDYSIERNNFPKPNFEKKIIFNNLSEQTVNYLKCGSYQSYVLDEFFQYNSSFVKEELKEILRSLYNELHDEIEYSVPYKNDIIFFLILIKCCPKKTLQYQSAVTVLMAYYFETCDIFKPPVMEGEIK